MCVHVHLCVCACLCVICLICICVVCLCVSERNHIKEEGFVLAHHLGLEVSLCGEVLLLLGLQEGEAGGPGGGGGSRSPQGSLREGGGR